MLINKIKNSLAFRLPIIYKLIISFFYVSAIRRKSIITNEYTLVMMCGIGQLPMLKVCLRSIYKQFSNLPHIILFTDLSSDTDQFKKALNLFPAGSISIVSGYDCINHHRRNKKNQLVLFAEKNPMGLKLAAILQTLESKKSVLYCDTDVIWYGDPYAIIHQHITNPNFDMAMSEDFQAAYDKHLIDNANLAKLYDKPYFCAGILLIKELSVNNQETLNRLLETVSEKSDHFSEQTIFAFLNRESNNILLDKNKFVIRTDDQFQIKPKRVPGILARHYTGPVRHIFWRDAFFRI